MLSNVYRHYYRLSIQTDENFNKQRSEVRSTFENDSFESDRGNRQKRGNYNFEGQPAQGASNLKNADRHL